jgi:hypothetical protein
MRVSRSQFYAKAIEEYVRSLSGDEITELLNDVYGSLPSTLEPNLEAASLEVLRRESSQ